MSDIERCHETVSQQRRAEMLDRDRHRCKSCAARGPGAGGIATLHAHHIDRDPDPDDVALHALANLTTLCLQCHSWFHHMPSADALPESVSETDAERDKLRGHDREILQVLAEGGPLTTGEIRTALMADVGVMTVRERCWKLMGLDEEIEARDRQVIDQDAATGKWGLPAQITQSARGRIPDAPEVMAQRAADERVRRAIDAGYDRAVVADLFGVTERTTYHMEKRARAYQFPLDLLDDRMGGRPPVNEETTDAEVAVATPQTGADSQPHGDAAAGSEGSGAAGSDQTEAVSAQVSSGAVNNCEAESQAERWGVEVDGDT